MIRKGVDLVQGGRSVIAGCLVKMLGCYSGVFVLVPSIVCSIRISSIRASSLK
jgi:hypothetical protein